MKNEKILLLSGNYFPEPTGIGKYNSEMMDWLSAQGYKCGVVTTYPYYPFWKIQEPYLKKSSWYKKEQRTVSDGVPIDVYRCPHYVPSTPSGKKRILSDLSFFLSAFFQVIRLLFREKYDYVITIAPPFQLGLLGLLYAKIKGAKSIYHIQDLQIDAAQELGMIKSNFLLGLMFRLERFILRKTDYISSISEGMIRNIKAKYNRSIILFPNWSDTQSFHPIFQKQSLKKQFNFSGTDKIVLYSGAIGEKQGLQALLHSARELDEHKDVKFVICGSGPYKEKLIDQSQTMQLQNVFFMPLQPKEKFNHFLNMADVHLVLQKVNDNDFFMPSKLTTILSVGGMALVTASKNTSLHTIISEHKIGMLVEPENQSALTNAIKKSLENPYDIIKNNARVYAEEYLSIDKVIAGYFAEIMKTRKSRTTIIFKMRKNQLQTNTAL
jgi:colanic acid biosynthesis glycosyl transferase WcaI